MNRLRPIWIVLALVYLLLASLEALRADENAAARPASDVLAEPPQLDVIWEDDFRADTRGDYRIGGEAQWRPGQLALGRGGYLARQFDGGWWSELQVMLLFDDSKTEQDSTRIRIELQMDGSLRLAIVGRATKSETILEAVVALSDGEVVQEETVRWVSQPGPLPSGKWIIEYRRGLIGVTPPGGERIYAYLPMHGTEVRGVQIHSVAADVTVRSLLVSSTESDDKRTTAEDQRNLAEVRRLSGHSVELWQQGHASEALVPAQQALEITKGTLGEVHPEYAHCVDNLAKLYFYLGDFGRAEPLFHESLEIKRKSLGERHPDFASSLNDLAHLYDAMGAYARAEPLYKQALQIERATLGEKHPDYATTLNNLALLYESLGEDARAAQLCRQSLQIRKEALGEDHPDYAISLNNLALMYFNMGDYARAEPLHRQAWDIRKRMLGENHPSCATSLDNLVALYFAMGDYAQAELLCRQALAIRKAAQGETHPDYALTLHNSAILYKAMGDYPRAESLLLQALDIRRATLGEQHRVFAVSLNDLGSLYLWMGDEARAEPLFRQAAEIIEATLGGRHPDYAVNLLNLALVSNSLGDHVRAESLMRQAQETVQATLGERHPDYAKTLISLGALCASRGDEAEAESLYRKGLEIIRDHLAQVTAVESERQQLAHQGRIRPFLDFYLGSMLRRNRSPELAWEAVLDWKGQTFVRQQRWRQLTGDPDASGLVRELQGVMRSLTAIARAVPAEDDQFAAWKQQMAELTDQREQLERRLSQRSLAFRDFAQRVTPGELVEALPDGAVLVDFLLYRNSQTYEEHLAVFIISARGAVQGIDLGPIRPISEAVDDWRIGFGQAGRSRDAASLLREEVWSPIESHLHGAKTVLIAADGPLARLPFHALPAEKEGEYLIERYRIAYVPVPQLLPELLKRQPDVPRGEGELLLVGDVDYEADPAGVDVPANDVRPEVGERDTLLASGSTRAGQMHFNRLDGAAAEIAFIKDLFGEVFAASPDAVEDLRGAAASEEAFRREAPRFRNLHVATHGFFADPKYPSIDEVNESDDASRAHLFSGPVSGADIIRGFHPGVLSGVALAGANRHPAADKDDGILTAAEVDVLPLYGVDLVVLSACETGLGPVAGGEGVLGLQRAFQLSGARTTVATLWKVNDVATRRLMERVYRNRWEHRMGKLDALREAQLWLLNHPGPASADATRAFGADVPRPAGDSAARTSPEDWAAFVLSGDWR
jgi:CHAT domain-containing protein/tetratricopeptide (TPR) repeat protein